jgi:hypothetical protein
MKMHQMAIAAVMLGLIAVAGCNNPVGNASTKTESVDVAQAKLPDMAALYKVGRKWVYSSTAAGSSTAADTITIEVKSVDASVATLSVTDGRGTRTQTLDLVKGDPFFGMSSVTSASAESGAYRVLTVSPSPTSGPQSPSPTASPTSGPQSPSPSPSPTSGPQSPSPSPSPTSGPQSPSPSPSPTSGPQSPSPTASPTSGPQSPSPTPSPTAAPLFPNLSPTPMSSSQSPSLSTTPTDGTPKPTATATIAPTSVSTVVPTATSSKAEKITVGAGPFNTLHQTYSQSSELNGASLALKYDTYINAKVGMVKMIVAIKVTPSANAPASKSSRSNSTVTLALKSFE